jgi:hypothetical protein
MYAIGNYIPIDCATDTPKYNRITAAGFIVNDVKDYTSELAWLDFIDTPTPAAVFVDEIKAIKGVRGAKEAEAWEKGAGFGTQNERIIGGDHKYMLTLEYNPKNEAFLRSLLVSCTFNAGFAYVVGDKEDLVVMPYVCTVSPQTPITEVIKNKRDTMLEITCTAIDIDYTIDFASPTEKAQVIALFF